MKSTGSSFFKQPFAFFLRTKILASQVSPCRLSGSRAKGKDESERSFKGQGKPEETTALVRHKGRQTNESKSFQNSNPLFP
jgi:hypothetical protein